MTKYLGTAAVAIFMIGAAVGHMLNAPTIAVAQSKVETISPEEITKHVRGLKDETPDESIIVAVDATVPGAN